MPLQFNDILRNEGIDPRSVKLVRHQDLGWKPRTPYILWRDDTQKFEDYQRIQSRKRFDTGDWIASFVVTQANETLFVGLFATEGLGQTPVDLVDPLTLQPAASQYFYQISLTSTLREYIGKLIVDWGPGFRSWVQRAHLQNKTILELRRIHHVDAFPGYMRFISSLSEVQALPTEWRARLTEAKGIYILTCPRTAEWYVGSAAGEGGFFERWCYHASVGGDALMLRSRSSSDYQVAILEVMGSSSSLHDILIAEQSWMDKLQTRGMGLNGKRCERH